MKFILFTAPWCKPCEAIKSYIHKYESYGTVQIIDVEEDSKTAAKYLVRGLPTVIIEKNGKVLEALVGALPEERFKEKLFKIIGS